MLVHSTDYRNGQPDEQSKSHALYQSSNNAALEIPKEAFNRYTLTPPGQERPVSRVNIDQTLTPFIARASTYQ